MILPLPPKKFETDQAGRIIYPVDNGEPFANDTEHFRWINFLKDGLDKWFHGREDVFVAADLLWYPIEGRPDISKAPDVMVVLNHPAGSRSSYLQWQENGRPPNVVFVFISKVSTAAELLEKQDFYSDMGCDEFFLYDYHRGILRAYSRGAHGLNQVSANPDGTWSSPLLGMTFGLDGSGQLWVRRPDGRLMESVQEVYSRAEAEAQRAQAEAERAERLAAKLRELGIDPSSV